MSEAEKAFQERSKAAIQAFDDAMGDDLNTADGLAAIFELVKDINTRILDKEVSKNVCETI